MECKGTETFFFTRSTMKFFGDTMANFGLRQPATLTKRDGSQVQAFELTRRHPVKHGLQSSHWFDAETLAEVFPRQEWEA